jgi:hypothetical protein
MFFEGPDHRRDLITEITETIDQRDDWPGWLCPAGPGLAADLLDDGLAAVLPKWQRRLIDVALRALEATSLPDGSSLAGGLGLAAETSHNYFLYIRTALKKALAGRPSARARALALLLTGDFGSALPDSPQAREGSKAAVSPTVNNATIGQLLRGHLSEIEQARGTFTKVDAARPQCRAGRGGGRWGRVCGRRDPSRRPSIPATAYFAFHAYTACRDTP